MSLKDNPEEKKAYMKQWRDSKKDHIKAYQKKWSEENREDRAEYMKIYMTSYASTSEAQLATWIRNLHRNYKMSPTQFNEMWVSQSGKCLICSCIMVPRGRGKDAVCVDHNHHTGKVRGLLCRACNHGIGMLKDDPDVMKAAAEYLITKGFYSNRKKDTK